MALSIVTRGFGTFSEVKFVVTRGFLAPIASLLWTEETVAPDGWNEESALSDGFTKESSLANTWDKETIL